MHRFSFGTKCSSKATTTGEAIFTTHSFTQTSNDFRRQVTHRFDLTSNTFTCLYFANQIAKISLETCSVKLQEGIAMQLHCLSRNMGVIDFSSTMTAHQLLNSIALGSNKLTPRLFVSKATTTSNKCSTLLKLDRQELESKLLMFSIEHSLIDQGHSKFACVIEIRVGLISSKTYNVFPIPQFGHFSQEAFDHKIGRFFVNLSFIHQGFNKIRENTFELRALAHVTRFENGTNSHVIIGIKTFPK